MCERSDKGHYWECGKRKWGKLNDNDDREEADKVSGMDVQEVRPDSDK